MNAQLQLIEPAAGQLEVRQPDGRPLFCYVYAPTTPEREAPRPYCHPVYSIDGDVVTNHRPNDHPWHHGLSLTLTSVGGTNFWGGPSYHAGEGYRWREDHGVQVHREWLHRDPEHLEHRLEWRALASQELLLLETRSLRPQLHPDGWSLEWTSRLQNVADRDLRCDNYHSAGGLEGSHYTGLQFRGARGLLDDHGDETIGVGIEGGAKGEAAVHGTSARWLEWQTQHDTSLRRTRIRFEAEHALPWFVRRNLPLVAFAAHREQPLHLPRDVRWSFTHRVGFFRA